MNVETAVAERYTAGAMRREEALCCPVSYDPRLLALLPSEILERDYGCGDPSRYVREGDVVLDLGSGGGKVCYLAAQLTGSSGRVIGVDINDEMLDLARRYQGLMEERLGGSRVHFAKGRIQDLALDVEAMEAFLAEHPVQDQRGLDRLRDWQDHQRRSRPLIADASIDLVISNCVLNLVDDRDKPQMIREIFRVLRPGGRAAICDIVADEPVPAEMKSDPELWSGCIAGAFVETDFIGAFVAAGFSAIRIEQWSPEPWRVLGGIEFRSMTVTAVKGDGRDCIDRGHAVIYRGPYAEIRDEEGHIFPRGERIAVCERTYRSLAEGPCRGDFIAIAPAELQDPVNWCAPAGTRRPASETKGGRQSVEGCQPGGTCC